MKKYSYSTQEQSTLERLRQPFAVYQFVDKRVSTLVLSDGFCKLFGYDDRALAYFDMDNNMYKDTHPDDAARIANAALRFATKGGQYEVVYRSKIKDSSDYRIESKISAGLTEFSVAVFDLNGLKAINDSCGHECGDMAIVDTANLLIGVFGKENIYRIGGDEFIAVEENVSSDDMHALFARLDLCLIEENATEKAYRTPLSISKGYTTFVPDIDTDYNKVFKRADEAMYRDKAEYYKTHDRRRG